MVLRTKEDIIFHLNGDENIIEFDMGYITQLVLENRYDTYELWEMSIPYNFVLGMVIQTGVKVTLFDGRRFESILHIDEYIREGPKDPVLLMIDFIVIFA